MQPPRGEGARPARLGPDGQRGTEEGREQAALLFALLSLRLLSCALSLISDLSPSPPPGPRRLPPGVSGEEAGNPAGKGDGGEEGSQGDAAGAGGMKAAARRTKVLEGGFWCWSRTS